MSEMWLKIKQHPWVVGVACGWVLLAFIFLCASVDHPLFSTVTVTKIYKTVSDIILLKWVTKYQTLLAGLTAVAGGLAAIWSTKLKIEADQLQKKEEKFTLIKNDLIIAWQILIDIEHELGSKKNKQKTIDKQVYYSVNQCDHLLGTFFNIFIDATYDDIDENDVPRMKAESDTLSTIILHFIRNFDDLQNCTLPFTGHYLEAPQDTIDEISKKHEIDPIGLKHYQRYFPKPTNDISTPPAAAAAHQPKS